MIRLLCKLICCGTNWLVCAECDASSTALCWTGCIGVMFGLFLAASAAWSCCCWCCAESWVVILMICDNLFGNDERDGDCSKFAIELLVLFTGNDCGRTVGTADPMPTEFILLFDAPFPFSIDERSDSLLTAGGSDVCCWRSKYDWTAFFWNAFSVIFETRVVLLGSKYVNFWLWLLLIRLLFCTLLLLLFFEVIRVEFWRSNSLMRSATDCQLWLWGDLHK